VPARRRDHREHHRTAGLEAEMPQVTNERRGVLRRVEQQVKEGTAERVVGRLRSAGSDDRGGDRGVSHADTETEARDPRIDESANVGVLLAVGPGQPEPGSRLAVIAAITPPIGRHFGQRHRYEFDTLSIWLAIAPSFPSEAVNSMMPAACRPHS
jgi:hypothetical protein